MDQPVIAIIVDSEQKLRSWFPVFEQTMSTGDGDSLRFAGGEQVLPGLIDDGANAGIDVAVVA